ncbi:MAG: hypothetical protein GXZ13_00005, partial [Synergistaceae bacterium]|nr:hypothetical protein [Synergistaceae bacterium]
MAVLVTLHVVAVGLMYFYQEKAIKKGSAHVSAHLQSTAKTQAEALNVALAGKQENLESFATVFEEEKELEIPKIIKYLNRAKDISHVSCMGFADAQGNAYLNDGS